MDLNATPSANRTHIAFFGVRNAGKSSVMNAVTGQNIAIVSDIKGTTTDPVYKAMELLPLGPVTIIDTPGIDDEGTLGQLRIEKTKQVLRKTDIAVLVVDAAKNMTSADHDMLKLFKEQKIPYVVAYNKIDKGTVPPVNTDNEHIVFISAKENKGIFELKERLAHLVKNEDEKTLLKDIVSSDDTVILVIPIDKAAPKGRLILPQQQTIREILDVGATAVITQDDKLAKTISELNVKPKLVITDSQAFENVNKQTPKDILLTSFSILFSRYKGNLLSQMKAVKTFDFLKDGDEVLVAEGCTHHRQCDDIGTVKLPRWIKDYTKTEPKFVFSSGTQFPDNLEKYKLIIHCGGCMLNEKEMQYRLACAKKQKVPMTNYGTAIAYMNGILKRSVQVFADIDEHYTDF
ncbi:[FeFe] hydrogenase H-cluster maturation GTPase HydF [Pectinatus haikarae]|uniref:[FeFe] hydrogenase H-cluster maturation GTPase HydF n=1 Tax=Pectinatus haikarae TaxID=349096 RepID=A0ABT9YAL5_9FIRM|nr:[FeFe] hydrogenase H-cluster maturation GTPase HydF [Pectinatus haikarae]MDQ0204688.1 [FeFe] hydrogenase H-cluster maturation GTPase HydF [Pectinatus haikarae]